MDEEKIIDTEQVEEEPIKESEPEKPEAKEEPEKKYSDEDLDAIISQKFAKWREKQEKEISEAKKLAEMDAQQKAEYERDKLQKKLEALEREITLNEMGRTARGMLSERGVNLSDDLVSILITDEAESTKANVDAFVELFNGAVEAAVTEKLKSGTPKRMAGGKTMTRDEILNIPDAEARRKAIQDNLELFN